MYGKPRRELRGIQKGESFMEAIIGFFGVLAGIFSTSSDFSGAYATLSETIGTILEWITSLAA